MLTPAAERATRPERCLPPWRVMLVVSFGAFLTSFDAGAITAVLPLIGRAFARGISDVQWVLAADLLVASALLLVFGRLGDRFGSRPFYVAGFGIFFCGCIVCGMAQNLTALIAFRAFQGVGTAMLLANSPAVLVRHLSSAIRGSAFGVKASCLYLGLVAGPLAAGWMAGHFGWRSVFAVEAPAALVGFMIATLCIPQERPAKRASYDPSSVCLCSLGLALGLWSFGHRASPTGLWLLPPAALIVAALIAAQQRDTKALFHYSCFRNKPFSASVFSLAVAFAASYMLTLALPFLLLEVRHESPSVTGRMMAMYAIARSSIAWYSGRWSDRIDSTLVTIPGLIVFMGSVAAISWLVSSSPISVLTATLAAAGLGFGCFIPPNNSTLMGSVPQELYGFGAAMMATSRTLGMAVGVALDGALLSNPSRSLVNSAALAFRLSALLALAAAITNALAAVPGRRGSTEAVLSEH